MHATRKAFTLIELLVVIAIIAILSVVVILTLNPAELLRQSRDSTRTSDMDTLNHALGIYVTDQSGNNSFSLGNVSTTYISIPDPSATSTAGDQCQGLGLPALSAGYTYHCAATSTYRLTNGTGWIPVNFGNISSGSPFGNLPVDPANASSSNLFYTYTTDGTTYVVTAIFESQKYKAQYAENAPINGYPEVAAQGSNLNLSELYNPAGLVGWWPLTEGSGAAAMDQSGHGNNGSWSGTAAGTNNTYYTTGKVGAYAGYFDGSTDQVAIPPSATLSPTTAITLAAWVKLPSGYFANGWNCILCEQSPYDPSPWMLRAGNTTIYFAMNNNAVDVPIYSDENDGSWHFIAGTYDGATGRIYLDGLLKTAESSSFAIPTASWDVYVGSSGYLGSLDDARVYNRALSAAEVQALYSAER